MNLKNDLLNQGIKATANAMFKERFAEILTLRLDVKNCKMQAELRLAGESETILVECTYQLLENTNEILLMDVQVSRLWLQNTIKALSEHKPLCFPLSGVLGKIGKMVLKGGV